jgi:hypothetical protein
MLPMVGIHQPCCRMTLAHICQPCTISYSTGMSSCSKSENALNKLNISTRISMITHTENCSSHQGSGSGFASCTGQWPPLTSRARASSCRNSLTRSWCLSAWATWLTSSADAKLHDVFHVGLLKSFCGDMPTSLGALPTICQGLACLELLTVTKSRVARGKLEVLVQWKDLPSAEASRVLLEEFRMLYPAFQLMDKLIVQGGGGDVMWGVTYKWCRKQTSAKAGP